ncbi:MAG: hypothetical protein J6N49_06580 [Alphaproteobacteria bacterium]|nr:hypothetical protein [Alphaproteobacteria bacterium]
MENYRKILEMNSTRQNEFLALSCLERHDLPSFLQLLKNGMPLTAFMLTSMVVLKYNKKYIKQVLIETECIENDNVVKWMQNFFSIDELINVLPEFEGNLPSDYPSNEDCVRFKLWKTLCERKEYELVANNASDPYGILSKQKNVAAQQALLKLDFVKYAPLVFGTGCYGAFLISEEGWKYLVDHGAVNWLLKFLNLSGIEPVSDVIKYCVDKGYAEEAFRSGYKDELLKHRAFDVFRKHHSFYSAFLENYPQEVDWEDLWNQYKKKSTRRYLKEKAGEHPEVPECSEFLWNHANWFARFWMLTYPKCVQ